MALPTMLNSACVSTISSDCIIVFAWQEVKVKSVAVFWTSCRKCCCAYKSILCVASMVSSVAPYYIVIVTCMGASWVDSVSAYFISAFFVASVSFFYITSWISAVSVYSAAVITLIKSIIYTISACFCSDWWLWGRNAGKPSWFEDALVTAAVVWKWITVITLKTSEV